MSKQSREGGCQSAVPSHTLIWDDPVSVDQLISPGCVQLCGHISTKKTNDVL